MVETVPNVLGIVGFEHDAIPLQGWNVYILHCVILQKETVIAIFVGITHHHPGHLFRAMVIAFVVAFVSTMHQIIVDVDRTQIIVGTWYIYCDDFLAIDMNCLNVFVM